MNRSKLREKVFRLLFQAEFHDQEEFAGQQELFFLQEEQETMSPEDSKTVSETCDKIMEKLPKIDEMLTEKMTGWSIDRVGKVELAILRLAVYEICFDDSIPPSVSINEAVELAKRYASEESYSFVNGVLAKFAGE
ncbi:MAG: transcription antitermination factor NusB [Lachnospiraceae bacterium]|nr:transcription antitermination factor NusB [Lachnospiraceae bacterium]